MFNPLDITIMRQSLKQVAIERNGRSLACGRCPIAKMGKCNVTVMDWCRDTFVEGFIKGAKYAQKAAKVA